MHNLARRRVKAPPSKRREARKGPMCEGPRGSTDIKVAEWLSGHYPSPLNYELFYRYLTAKNELKRRYKAQIGLKENHLSHKPLVSTRLEFSTGDTTINHDLNYVVEETGFKLLLKCEPVNGNGKTRRAYVITEVENRPSSDISKITETMENLLKLASEWAVHGREATEREAMKKDGMWAAWLKVRWNHI